MSWRDVLNPQPRTQNTHNPQNPGATVNSAYSADCAYTFPDAGEAKAANSADSAYSAYAAPPTTARAPQSHLQLPYDSDSGGHADPGEPCADCRGGYYWRNASDALWYCHTCRPPEGTPWATRTVPGGRLPLRKAQDVVAVLNEAVADLPLDVDELQVSLAPEDLSGIAQGHIQPATVRAFALCLIEQGPRMVGHTIHGAEVATYGPEYEEAEYGE